MSLIKVVDNKCIVGESNADFLLDVTESEPVTGTGARIWQFYFIATCVPEAHTIMYEAGESFGIGRTDDLREAHLFKTKKDAEFFIYQNPYVKKSDTIATNILSRTFCLSDSTIEGITKTGLLKSLPETMLKSLQNEVRKFFYGGQYGN